MSECGATTREWSISEYLSPCLLEIKVGFQCFLRLGEPELKAKIE